MKPGEVGLALPPSREADLRRGILDSVREYFAATHPPKDFVPGETPLPASGRFYDAEDMASLADAMLDFWLTAGRFADEFEQSLARRLGRRHALLVNSGSSANLLAVSALTAPEIKEKAIGPGDEVLSVAACFPTTVNPILQNGAMPVFVDIQQASYNVAPELLEAAIGPRTKAIILAHTLGNPFDLDAVVALAERHGLWLIEDCCDALGSTYGGRPVSSFGDLATFSFYPAHHITMGEGGAVVTSNARLNRLLTSFRDWGRDCWCGPGKANTCGKRFDWQLGGLPHGYDHKYTYSHLGYNLKATDLQASVGVAQLAKLDGFIGTRRRNFRRLYEGLKPYEDRLILPRALPQADPAWFGFPITIREGAGFSRNELIEFLESRKVETRLLFAGNVTQQPYFSGRPYRVVGELKNTDKTMRDTFWVGVYPGLSEVMMEYMVASFETFLNR